MALKNALIQFDFIIDNQLIIYKERSQAFIFSNYVRIMKLVSGHAGNIEASAKVLAQRQNRIEANRHLMDSDDYIDFFQQLDSYYSQLNHTQESNECRSKIFVRTYAHLSTCLREEECTHVNVGISHYHLGEYSLAASLLELALLEKGINFMDKAHILTHLISAYSKLNKPEKLLQNINKLRALHKSFINLKAPEYFWHYKTVSTVLKIYKEQEFVSETRELFKKIVGHVKKEIQSKNVPVEVCCEPDQYTLTFLDVYNLLTGLYDTEQYTEVVKIASFMIEAMNKVEVVQPGVLPNKLKLQLLMGKAKVNSKNYSGLQDIELVLEMILSNSKEYNYEDEKISACWELFPRVVYLEPCYQIKAAILRTLINSALSFFGILQSSVNTALSVFDSPRTKLLVLGAEKSLQDRIRSLTMSSSSSVQNEQVELSHAKELASTAGAFKYIVQAVTPLQELREILESFALTSSIILLKICVLSLQILFNGFFCFLLDIFVVWFKLTSLYLIYHCIRYRHLQLIMYFIADLFLCLRGLVAVFYVYRGAVRVFLKQPKDIGTITLCYLILYDLYWIIPVIRDPRFKYGMSDSPYVILIIDGS
jgi:tetratricopeptide (TPR) repeat protein